MENVVTPTCVDLTMDAQIVSPQVFSALNAAMKFAKENFIVTEIAIIAQWNRIGGKGDRC